MTVARQLSSKLVIGQSILLSRDPSTAHLTGVPCCSSSLDSSTSSGLSTTAISFLVDVSPGFPGAESSPSLRSAAPLRPLFCSTGLGMPLCRGESCPVPQFRKRNVSTPLHQLHRRHLFIVVNSDIAQSHRPAPDPSPSRTTQRRRTSSPSISLIQDPATIDKHPFFTALYLLVRSLDSHQHASRPSPRPGRLVPRNPAPPGWAVRAPRQPPDRDPELG